MSKEVITCLYCQSPNEIDNEQNDIGNCENCGMPLTQHAPEGRLSRLKRFLPFFWAIVIFCLVMIFYLPR
ncbi:DnrP protein [Thalassotalea sp. G2M2-11]|uniref:DnrP protein n=1 Tax=Thalassotalea sp. G2M2-11 TaxID=2787627 RepID=UPI0019D078CB|nr:DnrP protein [Thalassotalea sp. G2M2-11]